jgi:hypothetical protein
MSNENKPTEAKTLKNPSLATDSKTQRAVTLSPIGGEGQGEGAGHSVSEMSVGSGSKPRATPWSGTFLSARFFLVRAAALLILFALAHLLGLREYTTFLSGTTGSPDVSLRTSAFLGMIYLALYMGCVVLAPILVLAAGMVTLWQCKIKN